MKKPVKKKKKTSKTEPEKITKNLNFKSVSDLKAHIEVCKKNAIRSGDEYKQLVLNSLGPMPTSELQLFEFIERVLKYHEVIK
jgi:hypothetical protein